MQKHITPAQSLNFLLNTLVQKGYGKAPDKYFTNFLGDMRTESGRKNLRRVLVPRKINSLNRQYAAYRDLLSRAAFGHNGLQVLIDENLCDNQTLKTASAFGDVTNIYLQGMSGALDPDVWQYACASGIDLIITRDKHDFDDRDLTYIARRAWYESKGVYLPMLLHVSPELARQPEVFHKKLGSSVSDVFALSAARAGPVMAIDFNGVRQHICQANVMQAFARAQMSEDERYERQPRDAVRARQFLQAKLKKLPLDHQDDTAMKRIHREVRRDIARTRQQRNAEVSVTHPLSDAGRRFLRNHAPSAN